MEVYVYCTQYVRARGPLRALTTYGLKPTSTPDSFCCLGNQNKVIEGTDLNFGLLVCILPVRSSRSNRQASCSETLFSLCYKERTGVKQFRRYPSCHQFSTVPLMTGAQYDDCNKHNHDGDSKYGSNQWMNYQRPTLVDSDGQIQ